MTAQTAAGILSPEAQLLLASTTPDQAPAAFDLLHHPQFHWERLIALALREKATPALEELLRAAPPDSVPPEVRNEIVMVVRTMHVHMFRLEQLLIGALDILGSHDVDVVLLKGAGLAQTVYGSFAARPMYDLDLLVQHRDARCAWSALRESGWQHDAVEYPDDFYDSHYHLPPLRDELGSGLAIEIHTEPCDGAVRLTADEFRARARVVELHGRVTHVPSTTHQVLHLATHFAWTHGMGSAGWRTFRDLQYLMNAGIDWDDVITHAERVDASTSCYWTFRLARSLAGAAVPDGVLRALQPRRTKSMMRALERHYAAMLFAFSPAPCPSVRMTQLLWTLGMVRRGANPQRPWHRGLVWAETHGSPQHANAVRRMLSQTTRGREWSRYLGRVLMQRDTPALAAAGRPAER